MRLLHVCRRWQRLAVYAACECECGIYYIHIIYGVKAVRLGPVDGEKWVRLERYIWYDMYISRYRYIREERKKAHVAILPPSSAFTFHRFCCSTYYTLFGDEGQQIRVIRRNREKCDAFLLWCNTAVGHRDPSNCIQYADAG